MRGLSQVPFPASVTTAEQLARLPDDDHRYELVEGQLHRMSPVGGLHGVVVVRLATAVNAWVTEHDCGVVSTESGFVLRRSPDTVRAPELAFVRASRIPPTGIPRGYWTGAPDLAVEVLSPADRPSDVRNRARDYLRHGATLVWVINPAARECTVYRALSAMPVRVEHRLEGEDVLPGFSWPLARLFD